MTRPSEAILLGKLVQALDAVLAGAASAYRILGPLPATPVEFAELDELRGTGARALLKAIEQAQDILARLFRTYLVAEQIDVTDMTSRDIANQMEKYRLLSDADDWSGLVRLRNRLAHEYPVDPAAQRERVGDAIAAIPLLLKIREDVVTALRSKDYLT